MKKNLHPADRTTLCLTFVLSFVGFAIVYCFACMALGFLLISPQGRDTPFLVDVFIFINRIASMLMGTSYRDMDIVRATLLFAGIFAVAMTCRAHRKLRATYPPGYFDE